MFGSATEYLLPAFALLARKLGVRSIDRVSGATFRIDRLDSMVVSSAETGQCEKWHLAMLL